MFESRWVIRPTRWAAETPLCQLDYDDCWTGFDKAMPISIGQHNTAIYGDLLGYSEDRLAELAKSGVI